MDCSSGPGTQQQDVEASFSSLRPVWTRRRLDSVHPFTSWTASSMGPLGLCSSLCWAVLLLPHRVARPVPLLDTTNFYKTLDTRIYLSSRSEKKHSEF